MKRHEVDNNIQNIGIPPSEKEKNKISK